jgi:hypothetical protein
MVAMAMEPAFQICEVAGFELLPLVAVGGLDVQRAESDGHGEIDEAGEARERLELEPYRRGFFGRRRSLPEAGAEQEPPTRADDLVENPQRLLLAAVGVVGSDADDDVGGVVPGRCRSVDECNPIREPTAGGVRAGAREKLCVGVDADSCRGWSGGEDTQQQLAPAAADVDDCARTGLCEPTGDGIGALIGERGVEIEERVASGLGELGQLSIRYSTIVSGVATATEPYSGQRLLNVSTRCPASSLVMPWKTNVSLAESSTGGCVVEVGSRVASISARSGPSALPSERAMRSSIRTAQLTTPPRNSSSDPGASPGPW